MDGDLKMALIPYEVNLGALRDSDTSGGTNYYIGEVVNITDLNDVNVSLFSDRDGTVPLPQNGVSNVTDAAGVFSFFVAPGNYKIKSLGSEKLIDLGSGGGGSAILSLTLAEAIAKTDAIDGVTYVRISDNNSILFKYASGLNHNGRTVIDATGSSLQLMQVEFERTYEPLTWFIDGTLGSDSISNGVTSGSGAFKTLQFAWDQMPSIIRHQQTLQLSDGVHNTSSVPSSSQPRAAMLWGRGKVSTFRSALSGDDLTGAIVIKGNAADPSLAKVITGPEWKYGIYINKCNVALQDFSIESDGINQAEALLVAHRTDTFIHVLNCIVDGVAVGKAKIGATCESGGQIEYIDGKIKNTATGILTNTSGDNFTLSTRANSIVEGCTTGALVKNNSFMSINSLQNGVGKIKIIKTCATALAVNEGAQVTITGQDNGTDMPQIENPVTAEGGHIRCLFAEFLDTVTIENGSLQLRQSNYQNQLTLSNSDLWLKTSNSFVDAATENTAAVPIFYTTPSAGRIFDDGTNNIVGSTTRVYLVGSDILTYGGAAETQSISTIADTWEIVSTGGTKSDAQVDTTNVADGTVINLTSKTLGVTFTSGAHMDLAADFTVGVASTQLTGVTLAKVSAKWKVTGLGQTVP